MSRATFFLQECPTCGRQVQVRVEYLGRRVACQHCSAEFEANDGPSPRADCLIESGELLERAEQLLASTDDVRRWRPR